MFGTMLVVAFDGTVDTMEKRPPPPPLPVVNDQVKGETGNPSVSKTPAVINTSYCVLAESWEEGVKVTTVPAMLKEPGTAVVPPEGSTKKVPMFTVEASIVLENVALTVVVKATFVAPAAGDTVFAWVRAKAEETDPKMTAFTNSKKKNGNMPR
jgi:hypothetical protein